VAARNIPVRWQCRLSLRALVNPCDAIYGTHCCN